MLDAEREKIRWMRYRISAMSLPEMAYRLSGLLLIMQERKSSARTSPVILTDFSKEIWTQENPLGKWFSQNEAAAAAPEYFPGGLSATLSSAEAILKHQLEIFGKSISLGETIHWLQDPITGYEWPRRFWAALDYREARDNGGVKWLWEINRHHHILTLAKAFFITGTEKYAQEAVAQLGSWIDQNPNKGGPNWTSSLELSTRIINWVWALSFIQNSAALTDDIFQKIVTAVFFQAEHIQRHLSLYSSGNNHLIGEAAGLAVAGMAFPRLSQADHWKTTGLRILTAEVRNQINPDGSTPEQAIHYLLYVMDWCLAVMHYAKLSGAPLDRIFVERLHQSALFLSKMIDERGQVPGIGDSDDAWVLRLDDRPEANNYESVLATSAAWFADPALVLDNQEWDEKSWWLSGQAGRKTFENLQNRPHSKNHNRSAVFRSGGYCVLEAGSTKVIFDCGPLGYLAPAAHGHADALSVWVSSQGLPVLVDSGTYAYQEGGAWRAYFRSTAAHNTLRIDGLDQSEMLGDFLWGKRARARLVAWESSFESDLAVAEHDGYKLLGVLHRRALFFFKPDLLLIHDQLLGNGSHGIEQFWHLSPDATVEISGLGGRISIRELQVNFTAPGTAFDQPALVKGQQDPIQGWTSGAYGEKTPAPVLIYSGRCTLPASTTTAFWFGSSPQVDLQDAKAILLKKLGEVEK